MNIPPFSEILTDVNKVRALVRQVTAQTDNAEMKASLNGMCGELDNHMRELKTAMPAALGAIRNKKDELQAKAKQVKTDLGKVEAEIAKKKKAAAEKEPVEDQPIDAELAAQLRAELLGRYPLAGNTGSPLPPGEIWHDWRVDAMGEPS